MTQYLLQIFTNRHTPVAQDARMWSAISSDVLPTNNPLHSIVMTVGMDMPSSTRTHWFRVGVPSKLARVGQNAQLDIGE